VVSLESSLLLIFRFNLYIVEALVDIQFGEILDLAELKNKFRDKGERVLIFNSHGIQSTIVLYKLEHRPLLSFVEPISSVTSIYLHSKRDSVSMQL